MHHLVLSTLCQVMLHNNNRTSHLPLQYVKANTLSSTTSGSVAAMVILRSCKRDFVMPRIVNDNKDKHMKCGNPYRKYIVYMHAYNRHINAVL